MQQLQDLMHKEMSRKEFLVMVGFGLATACGLSVLIQLSGKSNPWRQDGTAGYGYGSGAYGGSSTGIA